MEGTSRTETATILFTDRVASTEQRNRIGETAADALQRTLDHLTEGAISAHHGTVVKQMGDGAMSTFASAADAINASVALLRSIARKNGVMPVEEQLRVGVGIASGDVAWTGEDCQGTPVVVAARLCADAGAGEILCDDLARGLARGRTGHDTVFDGDRELKGLPQPVTTYRVVWERSDESAIPFPALLQARPRDFPFAGRSREAQALRACFDAAQVEGPTVTLVTGEPGIGKTRLVGEVAQDVHDDGAAVLAGRFAESIAAPFAAWSAALSPLVLSLADDVLDAHVERFGGDAARIVPALRARRPDAPGPRTDDPDGETRIALDAVTDLVERATVGRALLLVLDDVHWADDASLTVLRHLPGALPADRQVLVVATYRDTDVDRRHPLSAALADLRRDARVERIRLRGLDDSAMCEFLEAAGGAPLEEQGRTFASMLVDETDGNPFFVGEILRHLAEAGTLVRADGRWVSSNPLEAAGIPEGVRDVVGQRLSRLGDLANELLRAAAVIGLEFDVALLLDATGADRDAATDALDAALNAAIVHETDLPGRLGFSHALVRATLLEELSTHRQVNLHLVVARALEARSNTSLGELAHHYLEAAPAGVEKRAIELALMASDEFADRGAHAETLALRRRALETFDLAGSADLGVRSHLLAKLARATHYVGDNDSGRRLAAEAADLARAAGDDVRLAEAGIEYEGYYGLFLVPDDFTGIEIMREALERLPANEASTRCRVLATLATAVALVDAGSADLAEEAMARAREIGDEHALMVALNAAGWALRHRGDSARTRLDLADELHQIGERRRTAFASGSAAYHGASALAALGRLDEALEVASTWSDSGDATTITRGYTVAAATFINALAQGRLDEAEQLRRATDSLLDGFRAAGGTVRVAWLADLAVARGDVDGLRAAAELAAENPFAAAAAPALKASFLALSNRADDARASLAAYSDGLTGGALSERSMWAHGLHPAWISGDAEHAREIVAHVDLPEDEYFGTLEFWRGSVAHWRGVAAATMGEHDRAIELLRYGLERNEDAGAPLFAMYSRVVLAETLQARNAPGDRREAGDLLANAQAAAASFGAHWWRERAAAACREL